MKADKVKEEKRRGANSGKSKSIQNPDGIRRKDYMTGEPLAPRSARAVWRKRGRPLLRFCSKTALSKAQVEGFDELKEDKILEEVKE